MRSICERKLPVIDRDNFIDQDSNYYDDYKNRKKCLDGGLNCEILSLGAKKWQKGKLRIKIVTEFCPDKSEEIESESPLDDIRKTINQ